MKSRCGALCFHGAQIMVCLERETTMKTKKMSVVSVLFVAIMSLSACGKKDLAIEIPLATESEAPAPVEAKVLESSYDLLNNTTPSSLVCRMILENNIDVEGARRRAIAQQERKIKEICKASSPTILSTEVKVACFELTNGDYSPRAQAKSTYRCK
jgi:hypothetical protein